MRELGAYVRQQRETARLSVRQLSAVAGVSNPYLSQIERGLRKPSAEVLHALARGLRISAESLYVKAGLLDPPASGPGGEVRSALGADPLLTDHQRQTLIRLYESFVGPAKGPAETPRPHVQR